MAAYRHETPKKQNLNSPCDRFAEDKKEDANKIIVCLSAVSIAKLILRFYIRMHFIRSHCCNSYYILSKYDEFTLRALLTS